MQTPKPQATASAVPHRQLHPHPTDRRNGANFPKYTIATSPLSKEIPQPSPESHRPSLRARDSVTSRASSVPSTPLDDIPRPLWDRTFIRTAITPEATNPDLSIEEITSTKLSLDDEEFLTSLPNSENNKQAKLRRSCGRKGIMDLFEDNSGRWKKMRRTLRKIPNDLFARKSRPSTPATGQISLDRPTTNESVLPEADLLTEAFVPQPAKSVDKGLEEKTVEPLVQLDYDGKPKEAISRSEEIIQISSRIREELKDSSRVQSGAGNSMQPPAHFKGPFLNCTAHKSSSKGRIAEKRCYVQPALPPNFPPPRPRLTDLRTTSGSGSGSGEEARHYTFSTHRASRPSSSNVSVGQKSAQTIGRTSRPSSRPGTTSESNQSISGITAVQRPLVFMDGEVAPSEILWDHGPVTQRPSTSSTTRPASNAGSRTITQNGAEPWTALSPEIEIGRDIPNWIKIPIFVPRRIEAKETCRAAKLHGSARGAAPLSPAAEEDNVKGFQAELNLSDTAISDFSFGSLQVQTSNQSFLERQAMLLNWENETSPRPSTSGRERLSQVFASAWQEGSSKLRRKGSKATDV
ncbi:hypothetical protein H2204_004426 [Knufia peltigerae]|uniref:Uncharacterized protein n=1 Tax=Knufia peltigerae TaxID=1002370 RepID=A0AA38Y7C1_9EURO|nr:hypothetical protein H2204_004426 [Knufia peltigerae]